MLTSPGSSSIGINPGNSALFRSLALEEGFQMSITSLKGFLSLPEGVGGPEQTPWCSGGCEQEQKGPLGAPLLAEPTCLYSRSLDALEIILF